MILAVAGHNFRFETENVIRIFFPLEKLTITEEKPSSQEDYIYTYLENGVIGCEVFISGKTEKREESVQGK